MPSWSTVLLGAIAGFAIIAGAIDVAVRPYLRPGHKSRLPEANREQKADTGYWLGGDPPW